MAAHKIGREHRRRALIGLPPGSIDAKSVLDAGNNGIIMTSDHFLEPRDHAWLGVLRTAQLRQHHDHALRRNGARARTLQR